MSLTKSFWIRPRALGVLFDKETQFNSMKQFWYHNWTTSIIFSELLHTLSLAQITDHVPWHYRYFLYEWTNYDTCSCDKYREYPGKFKWWNPKNVLVLREQTSETQVLRKFGTDKTEKSVGDITINFATNVAGWGG